MAVDEISVTRQLALTKAAKSLEQDKTRELNEKIDQLWPVLSAVKGDKSCAVEGSILRWLLKNMEGTATTAEQVRRYPPTWTILGYLFERISLYALSKIFQERRFIVVLQQTAKDISRPQKTEAPGSASRKRKRESPLTFDIDQLRSPTACVKSATEVFKALTRLIHRLDGPAGLDHGDSLVAAEHIKTLFRVPATDAKETISSLILVCGQCLIVPETEISEDMLRWVDILTTIWDLRLGQKDDPHVFTTHLYFPSFFVLEKLEKLKSATAAPEWQALRVLWASRFKRLLMKNTVNPAQTSFLDKGNLELISAASTAAGRYAALSCQILWDLTVKSHRDSDDPASRTAYAQWFQSSFDLLIGSLECNDSADQVISGLLDTAIQSGCSPNPKTLRDVCKKYALQADSTHWDIVAKIIQCDPHVFLLDDEMLTTVLQRVTSNSVKDAAEQNIIVVGVVNPLMSALSKARDLSGFVEKWYEQLSELEAARPNLAGLNGHAWLDPRVRGQFAKLFQSALSVKQLLKLLDRLNPSENRSVGAFLVILSAICDGLTEEDFIEVASQRMVQIAVQDLGNHTLSLDILALKWRIASKTASLLDLEDSNKMWEKTRSSLSEILTRGSLAEPATLQAFDYGCNIYGHISCCDDSLIMLLRAFVGRIVAEAEGNDGPEREIINAVSSRLYSLNKLDGEGSDIPKLVTKLSTMATRLAQTSQQTPATDWRILESSPRTSHSDEKDARATALNKLLTEGVWTHPRSISIMQDFLMLPAADQFTKEQRKALMSSWRDSRLAIIKHSISDVSYASTILHLLTSVTQEPTFYSGMRFDDILDFVLKMPHHSQELVATSERLVRLTISQMIGSPKALSSAYFQDVARYVEALNPKKADDLVVHLVVLKAIVSSLRKCTQEGHNGTNVSMSKATRTLTKTIKTALSQVALKWDQVQGMNDTGICLILVTTLDAADSIKDEAKARPLKLSSDTVDKLSTASEALCVQGNDAGWRLKALLLRNQAPLTDTSDLVEQLGKLSVENPDEWVIDLVDTNLRDRDDGWTLELLRQLLGKCAVQNDSMAFLVAVERIIDMLSAAPSPITTEDGSTFDLAAVHLSLMGLLGQTSSVEQLELIYKAALCLLDKHSKSMTQANIDFTLSEVAIICSADGPIISGGHAGKIFSDSLELLMAMIRKHRLRLQGRSHLIISVLHAVLRTLLADPNDWTSHSGPSPVSRNATTPPWLDSRLSSRHAKGVTRLLQLICEPSAASVTRWQPGQTLNSATEEAKRAAGQFMFRVLKSYIDLSLEFPDVPAATRKELKLGVKCILDITTEEKLKILNESLDNGGRTIFRLMYAEYIKFEKWKGV